METIFIMIGFYGCSCMYVCNNMHEWVLVTMHCNDA